ncbi:MAG: DNA-binding protein WhiA [Oscillospiraceae bacterium]|nr:DNA-binding protein WhiA [Clostridiaceae bacterium]MDO4495887.1 DNA-binding protein WhiA [Clostridiaceae bacterium]MDY5947783.1 DNA-binding protein WhiA [Oscillospiraceae bacterium]
MSFSSDVKSEISKAENISSCCFHAQVYGLVLFAHFSKYNLSITTENTDVFSLYVSYLREYCGVEPIISKSGTKKMTAYVKTDADKTKVFDKFGHSFNEATLRINRANISDECCAGAFLRGAFLSCGTVTSPESGYHLEFVVPYKKLCTDLMKFLDELNLNPKYIVRKGNHIVYFKDSESIEDILAIIGAQDASLYVMGIKIEKDVKNKVNRKLNFEISNISKTVDAAQIQISAIELIESRQGLSSLPDNLQKIARLRLEYPESSLSELEKLLDEPISRSGINHRLNKIVKIAQDIECGD